MKVSVLQENLSKIVSAVARSVAARPQLPVLSNILLRAEKGRLLLVGTDLMTAVGLSMGGKIEKAGAVTVPAREMAALIGNLPVGRVELVARGGKLQVTAGTMKASLLGIPASEFPDVGMGEEKGFWVPADEFARAVDRTQFCVSLDEGRPILTGVKIESGTEGGEGKKTKRAKGDNGGLRLVATDGYRLSIVRLKKVTGQLKETMVVPGRTLVEVLRLAEGKRLRVGLTEDGGIRFEFEDGWVTGKLLAGDFPAVDQILPKDIEIAVTIDREELEKAVRVAAIFARESANIVKWRVEKGKLKVSANSPQIGENETLVEVGPFDPAGYRPVPGSVPSRLAGRQGKGRGRGVKEIAFNSRYLLDYLGSVSDTERVVFSMSGPLKPGLFRVEGDDSYEHVIMPVRVQK